MNTIVVGTADDMLAQNILGNIEPVQGFEVAAIAPTVGELLDAVRLHRPQTVLVHEQLPPGAVYAAVREVLGLDPSVSVIVLSRSTRPENLEAALHSGARSILEFPFVGQDLQDRLKAADQWTQLVRSAQAKAAGDAARGATSGKLMLFVGAKGGVGTTITATHLAWDIARTASNKSVCLVDLNLESGDVPSYLGVSYRVSVADVCRLGDDITSRVISESVTTHPSGLNMLPAPREIRDVDAVTPEAVRQLCAELKATYDVVIVDGGANVTPHQVAAVQMADEVVQLITSDVPTLRAARRQQDAWGSLNVSPRNPLRVLLTKYSRKNEIQLASADELIDGSRLETTIPAMFAKLEGSVNTRNPEQVKEKAWWNSLRQVGAELDVLNVGSRGLHDADDPAAHVEPSAPKQPVGDRGAVAVEQAALFPMALALVLLVIQLGAVGMQQFWVHQAANIAAREVAVGEDPWHELRERIPASNLQGINVASGRNSVTVTKPSGLFIMWWADTTFTLSAHREFVREGRVNHGSP